MIGDISTGRNVTYFLKSQNKTLNYLFKNIKNSFSKFDIVIGNLEGAQTNL
jgi:hypothetical protein